MSVNYLDILIVGLILLSGLVGIFRGLVKELVSTAAWILAVILGIAHGEQLGNLLFSAQSMEPSWVPRAVGISVIFIVVLVASVFVQRLVRKGVQLVGLGGLDRTLGFVFGLIRGVFAVIAVGIIFDLGTSAESPWIDSRLFNFLLKFEDLVQDVLSYFSAYIPAVTSQ